MSGDDVLGLSHEDAIRVLEVTDYSSLSVHDLDGLRKRAMGRWHPDRIARGNSDSEQIAEYQANFVMIEPAVELLRRLLTGEEDVAPRKESHNGRVKPEEAVRKHANGNQERLRRAWVDKKGQSEFFEEENVVIFEGISVAEALKSDLDDDMPATAVLSFAAGQAFMIVAMIGFLIPGIILSIIGLDWVVSLIVGISFIIWAAHGISCLIALAPLSRLWMPEQVIQIAGKFVDWPIGWVLEWGESLYAALAQIVLGLVSFLVQNLVVRPVYWVASQIWSEKRLFRAEEKIRYYDGLSEAYIDRLSEKDTLEMNLEELFDLSHAASRLGAN